MDQPRNESDIEKIKNDSVNSNDKSLPGFESESANNPKSTEWPLKGEQEQEQEQAEAEDVGEPEGSTAARRTDAEESFIAATHGTDEAPQGHPTSIGDPRESTGRKADESWKQKKRGEGDS